MVEWQAQEVGFDAPGGGQGQQGRGTVAQRDARDAWVAEYSVGFYFDDKRKGILIRIWVLDSY